MKQISSTTRGRLPLHLEISEMLAREIKAGVLLDGERLEPERVMAKRLGIAVGTLRKALAELHAMGLLDRVQGSGNYVRNVDAHQSIYGFFRLELLSGGGLPSADTLSIDRLSGDGMVSFAEEDAYYRIRRLRLLNGQPAALEEIWFEANRCSETLTLNSLSHSLYQFYKDTLGFWIARVEDSVAVSEAPQWRPADYCADAPAVWGYVERSGWDQHGRQAEFSRTWFDVRSTRYVARWT